MPRPFQAFAGAINETDAKVPNYSFFKTALTDDAKSKNCVFNSPWDFCPTADVCFYPVPFNLIVFPFQLPPVPETVNQTQSDFDVNQNLIASNFVTEKPRTIRRDRKEKKENNDVQVSCHPSF